MMTHGAAPVRTRTSDQARSDGAVLEDWLVERALDRGYEVTDAPLSGNNGITEQALIARVTAQCTHDRVVQTFGSAIDTVLDGLDAERAPAPPSR
jgi:hypothetical protein